MHRFLVIVMLLESFTLARADVVSQASKCDQVIAQKSKIQNEATLEDLDAYVRLQAIIARCYFDRGKQSEAEDQLRTILFQQPAFELDAFENPAPLVAMFNRIKGELQQKTRELQRIKENADRQSDVLQTDIYFRKMSKLAPFVPFGYAQFEYGAATKGFIIAGLEMLFLGANIGSYWYKRSFLLPDAPGLVANDADLSSYQRGQTFQWVSLGLFLGVWAFGAIDGIIHKDDLLIEDTLSKNQRISREEFLQKLNAIKKKD